MTGRQSNYFSKARVETLSDGIFAIILTLLVLSIQVPLLQNPGSGEELLSALWKLLPKVLSWMASFLMVCVIWVNHHHIFKQLNDITPGLFWLNANLLLWCSFLPFPTALMGEYSANYVALSCFGIILGITSLSFYLIRVNILSNIEVLNKEVDIQHYKAATLRSLIFGPVLYLLGAAVSFIHPYLSFGFYCFVPLYFICYDSFRFKAA